MFSFLGRWFGRLSLSQIISKLDFDFKTQLKNGVFSAVVMVRVFGRVVFSDTIELLNLKEPLDSVFDVDVVNKSDGQYLKIQFEIAGRVILKELIKVSDVAAQDAPKKPKTLTLDSPVDVIRENQLSHKQLERLISDIALKN